MLNKLISSVNMLLSNIDRMAWYEDVPVNGVEISASLAVRESCTAPRGCNVTWNDGVGVLNTCVTSGPPAHAALFEPFICFW